MSLTFVRHSTRVKRTRPLFLLAGAALLLSSITFTVIAQSNYASLSGTVYDPQHRAIPGAAVQLTADSTHAVRQVVSNEQGIFQITGLLPDQYKFSVQAPGFALFNQSLRFEVDQPTTLVVYVARSSLIATVRLEPVRAN